VRGKYCLAGHEQCPAEWPSQPNKPYEKTYCIELDMPKQCTKTWDFNAKAMQMITAKSRRYFSEK